MIKELELKEDGKLIEILPNEDEENKGAEITEDELFQGILVIESPQAIPFRLEKINLGSNYVFAWITPFSDVLINRQPFDASSPITNGHNIKIEDFYAFMKRVYEITSINKAFNFYLFTQDKLNKEYNEYLKRIKPAMEYCLRQIVYSYKSDKLDYFIAFNFEPINVMTKPITSKFDLLDI